MIKAIYRTIRNILYPSPFNELEAKLRKNVAVNIFDVEHFRTMSHKQLLEFFAKSHTEDVDADKVELKREEIIKEATEEIEVAMNQMASIGAIQDTRPKCLEEHAYDTMRVGRKYLYRMNLEREKETRKLEVENKGEDVELVAKVVTKD